MNEPSGIKLSIQQRLSLSIFLLTFLVVAASGTGLWFVASAGGSLRNLARGVEQIGKVKEIQLTWMSIVSAVDNMMLSRSVSGNREQLLQRYDDFTRQINEFSNAQVGVSLQRIMENRTILEELKLTDADLGSFLDEYVSMATAGRWGSALTLRQTRLVALQRSLDENLNQLSANLQEDVNRSVAIASALQSIARPYWIIIPILALGASFIISWLAYRNIVQPIRTLTSSVERITGGDFTPVVPIPQMDEIGNLSRSIALMTDWLRESYQSLEKRVAERTQALERRTVQLQVAADVVREITTARRLDDLLNHAVNLIRERFGFYHAGIFLVDDRNEFAVLRAATGEAGQEMLRREHKLRIGETGLVGYVTDRGESRIALDVGQDAVHFKNPLLPATRSEVALPLKVADRVIGALDVQSEQAAAFDEDSIRILQIIADQLAVAIQNSRLIQESQTSLQELESAYSLYGRQVWDAYIKQLSSSHNPVIGYRYDGVSLTPVFPSLQTGSPMEEAKTDGKKAVSIPLQVRGEIIGTLDVWPQQDELPPDQLYLLANISNRLSQTLESVRLFEETQARAFREQTINWINSQVSGSIQLETILQNTVRELGKALGASRTIIHIGASSNLETPQPSGVKAAEVADQPTEQQELEGRD